MRFCPELLWPDEYSKVPRMTDKTFVVGVCGSVSSRRKKITDACQAAGICVLHIGGEHKLVFGSQRDQEWKKCSVALSISCYDENQPVPQARIAPLLANHLLVVCETSPDSEDFKGPIYVSYDQVIDKLLELQALSAERIALMASQYGDLYIQDKE